MTVTESATWHVLTSWRDDAELSMRCRSCSVPIRVGDTYRVAGIYILCTLRPFCPAPARPVIASDPPRTYRRKRLHRVVAIGKHRKYRAAGRERLPLAVCRCGKSFHQSTWHGRSQETCSRACAYRLLADRAAMHRQRDCPVCGCTFTYISAHARVKTCSPSCGARLREQRKRAERAAA